MKKESKSPDVAIEAKVEVKKVKSNPDFVLMINPKGVEVEIHKDRVEELSKQGYKKA